MREWELYVLTLSFGVFLLSCGLALRDQDSRLASIGLISVGGLFMILGIVGLAVGHSRELVPFPADSKRHLLVFGVLLVIVASVFMLFVTYSYLVLKTPPAEGEAEWIKWVYIAGLCWFVLAGVMLARAALRP